MKESFVVRLWLEGGESLTLGTVEASTQKGAQARVADMLVEKGMPRERIGLDMISHRDLFLPSSVSLSVRPLPDLKDALAIALLLAVRK